MRPILHLINHLLVQFLHLLMPDVIDIVYFLLNAVLFVPVEPQQILNMLSLRVVAESDSFFDALFR